MVHKTAKDLETVVERAAVELAKLSSETIANRPAPDRWTIKQVLGHLIDSAANNHQRFVRAQQVVGDELVFPKYYQNDWVDAQDYDACEWLNLIQLWTAYNIHLAHVIRAMRADALQVACRIGGAESVTLGFLVTDYLDHLKHHLRKIAERIDADWAFASD